MVTVQMIVTDMVLECSASRMGGKNQICVVLYSSTERLAETRNKTASVTDDLPDSMCKKGFTKTSEFYCKTKIS